MQPQMTYSKTGLHLTESFEACKLKAYRDANGVWTIGYGHTCGVIEGMTCTPLKAAEWLTKDVQRTECAVNAMVQWPLTQDEFDALVDFAFNVGINAFHRSTLLQLLNVQNFLGAANEFEKWDHVSGRVCAGLLRRRETERALFEMENSRVPAQREESNGGQTT